MLRKFRLRNLHGVTAILKRFSWILAVVNIAAIGYGITNVYYSSDLNSATIYCVGANNRNYPVPAGYTPVIDPTKIDVTIGLNRTESFGSGYAEPMSTTWRITLLLNFPSQEWGYVNASTAAPVSLGRSTQFNMTLDSTYFSAPSNITVDSVSVTNTYSSGNVFFPLGLVHVNTKSVSLNLPYNSTNTSLRLLKLRQILIQNILLLSGLPTVTIPHGCLRNGIY